MTEQNNPGHAVHLEYKIDLSNPTSEGLESIKNDLTRKIAENVAAEQQGLGGGGGLEADAMPTHDRHYSIHSRD